MTVGVVGRMVSNSEVIIDDQAESEKANQDAMDAVITVWDEKICWDQTSGVNKGTSITSESIIPLVNNDDSIRGNLKKAVEVDSHAQLVHTTTLSMVESISHGHKGAA